MGNRTGPDGLIPGYAAAVADSGTGHRHDTIVLGQPGEQTYDSGAWTAWPAPSSAPTSWGPPQGAAPTGWGPPPSWSTVPPWSTTAAPPVHRPQQRGRRGRDARVGLVVPVALPLIGVVAWVLAPIGLLSSAVGLFVGMGRRVGRVGALWGLATSGLALLICLAWVALLLAI